MARWGRGIVPAALAAVFAVGLFAAPSSAKSFRIVAVNIDARLLETGAMNVVEHITYQFEGEFHNGTRPIPPTPLTEIVEMRVSEQGRPLPFDGAPYNLHWTYDARDEQRTFDIAYTVVGAARRWADVAELYWQWVGSDHPGVGLVRVHLVLPGIGAEVRAWGHGPLDGVVALNGPNISWEADGLPPGRFVEGRVALPVGLISGGRQTPAPRLAQILAEETGWADQANAERASAIRRQEQVRRLTRYYWVLPLLGWVSWFLIWREWGKEPPPPADVGDYVREPLDDSPAVARTILDWGTVANVAFSATLVDLAQRGALTITEERKDRLIGKDKVDFRFKKGKTLSGLQPYDQAALDIVFSRGDETTQSELLDWSKEHQSTARGLWTGFLDDVKVAFAANGYQETGRAAPYLFNVLASIVVGATGVLAVASGAPIGILGIVSGVGQLLASVPLRRRTTRGARRAAEWRAFKKFLVDFSRLEDAPIGHLILWERYLVYSVAFGVSDEVAKGLAMKVPPEQRSTFAPWYVGYDGTGRHFGSFGDFGSFGASLASASTPQSSGSGGGGGFSGGGGGGGGGGGIGAS